jgi:hypothetical protein
LVKLLTGSVWTELRRAAKAARGPTHAAIAYFSDGADRLLPLRAGSVLVCDASVPTVRSGATHPATLARLVRRGVRVYSSPSLHTKVLVIGRRAFVGSANASRSSADRLFEAVVTTDSPQVMSAARRLVTTLAIEALSPVVLERLQSEYRPPRLLKGPAKRRSRSPLTTPLKVVQLHLDDYPGDEDTVVKAGRQTAKEHRQHGSAWEVQEFRLTGRNSLRRGDSVVQVVDEGGRSPMVEPPGTVLHVQHYRTKRGRVAYVFVEIRRLSRRPTRRQITKALGRGVGAGLGKGRRLPKAHGDELRGYFERRP